MGAWETEPRPSSRSLRPCSSCKLSGWRCAFRAAQLVALACLVACGMVAEESRYSPSYKRSEWSHWRDFDGDCQNTRQEVLIASSTRSVSFASGSGCRVVAGEWMDPYSGKVFTESRLLDIDHVVALKDAFSSGGYLWTREQKKVFANDPANLIAVSASENRSKGSKGPDEWLPSNREYRCEYISKWVAVKQSYGLSMTACESSVVNYMMRVCEAGMVPPRPK